MSGVKYRIDFTVQARGPDDEDFVDVGYGSSGEWSTVDQAAQMVESAVQNREWETDPGMPAPEQAP